MKIETCGWYKRRDGKKARVVCVDVIKGKPTAIVDGLDIDSVYTTGVDGRSVEGEDNTWDLIALWTDEPVLRPWKPEEVPVGAITRMKPSVNASNPSRQIITGENGVMIFVCGIPYDPDDLLARREHSLDHGKTWLPCGVMEDAK